MKEGQLFFTSSGSYSDYGLGSFMRAKKTFSFDAEFERWIATDVGYVQNVQRYSGGYYRNQFNFLKYLEDKGLVEDLDVKEVHLGDYGDMSAYSANDREDDNVAG